jgi:hypothetical protein
MKLVILFGPPAVGKMTVGLELERLTGLRLFHNHMTIELVLRFFPHGTPPFARLVSEFRRRIFEEVAASDLPGLVFTYVWALDDPRDKAAVDAFIEPFRARGADICYAELEATQEERMRRNKTDLRLANKPSKRDLAASEERLLADDRSYRLNSNGDFFHPERHVKIENTALGPEAVARRIALVFGIPLLAAADSE